MRKERLAVISEAFLRLSAATSSGRNIKQPAPFDERKRPFVARCRGFAALGTPFVVSLACCGIIATNGAISPQFSNLLIDPAGAPGC